jgi:hypothetical protein
MPSLAARGCTVVHVVHLNSWFAAHKKLQARPPYTCHSAPGAKFHIHTFATFCAKIATACR